MPSAYYSPFQLVNTYFVSYSLECVIMDDAFSSFGLMSLYILTKQEIVDRFYLVVILHNIMFMLG